MCRLKSGIILRDRIFVPEYDSHTKMLEELGIEDNYLTASKTFVRFELSPKDGDTFSSIDSWVLNIDQDIVPDWYDEEIYKPQVVEKVKDWAKDHIHIGIDNLDISFGDEHYIKDCKNVCIRGNATVEYIGGSTTISYIASDAIVNWICDSTRVDHIFGEATVFHIIENVMVRNMSGNTTIRTISGNARVENIFGNVIIMSIRGNATVGNIFDKAIITSIHGNAVITGIHGDVIVKDMFSKARIKNIGGNTIVENICGDTIIENIYGKAIVINDSFIWKNKNTLTISEDATFKDCETKTIYQSKDWKIVNTNNDNIEHE